ncbi:hypothetical protein DY240_09670 [Jiangella rhizosphaerae]|uniref:Uncharacterized protein n=1 Tax=Jiangella rhizosphaerae TaxID=2293569 RepID=A0A418KT77_9ACTN|nr:hypothetical protein DY240_09670 [Jiangella rhizosphaerae]
MLRLLRRYRRKPPPPAAARIARGSRPPPPPPSLEPAAPPPPPPPEPPSAITRSADSMKFVMPAPRSPFELASSDRAASKTPSWISVEPALSC